MKIFVTAIALCLGTIHLMGQVSFSFSSAPSVSQNPFWVTAADVNGDGSIDLISASFTGNVLTVLTNNGSGGFTLASTLPVGYNTVSIVAADFDGDSKPDLACANYGDNTLSVLTNSGGGNFTLSATLNVGNNPHSVAAADVNGDGKMDLICANFSGNNLSVLTNDGTGKFVLASNPTVGNAPFCVIAADVNGDGKMDLITANYGDNTLTVLTNNGNGGFVLSSTLFAGSNPVDVKAVDVNNDGKIDLICVNTHGNSLTVFTNDGKGEFVVSATLPVGNVPVSVAATDLSNDGSVDLVCANSYDSTLTVLTNKGNGNFASAIMLNVGIPPSYPSCVTSGDVNGDGRIDLISANFNDNNLTILTNSTPNAPQIISQPQSITNNLGDTVAFQVTATNYYPLTYQWFFNNSPVSSATNNSLIISNLQPANFGDYYVVVAGPGGSITSQVAILFELATITSEPTNVVASYDSSATFSVAAVGYPAINFYQWSMNGTNLPGANSNSLTISRLGLQNTGNYQVLVSNAISSATSSVATLNMSPSIAIPFIGATPIWGQSATISVGAIGNGTLSYQWYFNGTPIAGATGPGINFPSIQFTNNGFYSVVISSPYGSVTNVAAQVAVDPAVVTLGFSPTLSINGAAGNSYLIQRSADLTNTNNWKNMTTITLFQQHQIWVDTSVDASSPFNNKYFYQLIPQY